MAKNLWRSSSRGARGTRLFCITTGREIRKVMDTSKNHVFLQMSPPRDWLQAVKDKHKLPAITLSYHPSKEGDPNRWGKKNDIPDDKLLALLKLDLSNGITNIESTAPTRDGRERLNIRGTHWEVTVVEDCGKKSGLPVGVLQSVSKLKYSSKALLVEPERVDFDPIWEESVFNASEIKERYWAVKSALKSAEHQLTHPEGDRSVLRLKEDHATARKQYSALRLMMSLLRLKSEQDKYVFDAEVLPPSDVRLLPDDNAEKEDKNVHLKLKGKEANDILDTGVLIEVILSEGARPLRTKILAVNVTSDGFVIELDLPADRIQKVDHVTVSNVSRFGMWAHERAVSDFLSEQVHGYWQNLAHLLCSPRDIVPASQPFSAPKFYCDGVPGGHKLNERQRLAVVGAVNAPSVFCIQGPPGTGKTTVICEIVQHLIARKERVLMVAPTHVAIDEVLRRIGGRPGVHAVRLSWDDSRVAKDIHQYLPNAWSNTLNNAISASSQSKVTEWRSERLSLEVSLELLEKLINTMNSEFSSHQSFENDKQELEGFERKYPALHSELQQRLETVTAKHIDRCHDRVVAEAASLASREFLEVVRSGAGIGTKLLGYIGLGRLGKANRHCATLSKELSAIHQVVSALEKKKKELTGKLDALAKALAAKRRVASASEGEYLTQVKLREEMQVNCQTNPILTAKEFDLGSASALHEQILHRVKRLAVYPRLAETFQALITAEEGSGIDRESLQRDLVNSANLFCCTTTGVAGSKELSGLEFDTLIIDEASRVTDSEFLIGAVRARRWLLVGDENQLPPYVEQQDEHFIHALSALQRSSDQSLALEDAIAELGELWHEDEELHKFRNDSVLRFATELLSSGTWDSLYRDVYREGIGKLKREVDDPVKALLKAMRESIVHSLFERVVVGCPNGAKVRLGEQRRMIEPIARIVSQPVYGGDYQSPSVAELAKSGVTPLTTTTFRTPITFLDTSLLGLRGREELIRNSFVNKAEANIIVRACLIIERETAESSTEAVTVSILAFYKAQARLIELELGKHRFHHLKFSVIDAIDRIQGQESDVVFLSFTRTAGKHVSSQFGQWLQDIRRLNVACTRAHRALFLVGQKEMLTKLHSNQQAVAFYKHLDSLFEQYPKDMTIIKHLGDH